MSNWLNGDYGSSMLVFHGLIELQVTAYAKKAVTVNGIRYGKNDMRAFNEPGNVYWKAEIKGKGPAIKVGEFDSREEAQEAVLAKFQSLYG